MVLVSLDKKTWHKKSMGQSFLTAEMVWTNHVAVLLHIEVLLKSIASPLQTSFVFLFFDIFVTVKCFRL